MNPAYPPKAALFAFCVLGLAQVSATARAETAVPHPVKPVAHRAKHLAQPPESRDAVRPQPQRTTIPMDFSGMERRATDVGDPRSPANPLPADASPVLPNGTIPGATFKF